MANTTDPFANAVHGTNPQYLVEKITRLKIYNTVYWKEECFGLTAATIIDKAVELKYYGGTYGGNLIPTKFLCLLLKMLQLQPEKEIVYEFIQNEDFPYLRILGAFYLRLTGKAEEIYTHLEPLYNDYRTIIMRNVQGFSTSHMDEFVDDLLREELVCDITLPHLIKRIKMEEMKLLPPRESLLEEELGEMDEDSDDGGDEERKEVDNSEEIPSPTENVRGVEVVPAQTEENIELKKDVAAVTFEDEEGEEEEERKEIQQVAVKDKISEEKLFSKNSTPQLQDDDYRKRQSRSPDDRRQDESRHRRRRSRDNDRKNRRSHSPSSDRDDRRYKSRRRSRSRSRSKERRDSRDYDRIGSRYDSRDRKRRDRSRSRGRNSSSEDRQSRRRKKEDDNLDRHEERSNRYSRKEEKVDEEDRRKIKEEDDIMEFSGANAAQKLNEKQKKNEKLFDKMFGKKKSNDTSGGGSKSNAKVVGKEVVGANGQKFMITAPEGTIEYWNQMREALGMKKLK